MDILLKLLLAHFIGDFLLQPSRWVESKRAKKYKSPALYAHLGVHALLVLAFTGFDLNLWWVVVVVTLSHGLIDLAKLALEKVEPQSRLFWMDQLLHLFVIVAVSVMHDPNELTFFSRILSDDMLMQQVLFLLLCILILTSVMSVVMKVMLNRWAMQVEGDVNPNSGSLEKAGKYIGMLERVLIFVFIVVNQWAAIGFLIAAKSVFRFSDLSRAKDRMLTEYVLIGTLISFGSAILIGLLFRLSQTLILQSHY